MMITWWQLIALLLLWTAGLILFARRSLGRIHLLIKRTLDQHRQKAVEMVGQGIQQQLQGVKEELKTALADVVRAEAAQLVAETAQDVAEDATQAKTDFLSRMSHEIRTPINGIVGSLALLNPQELTQQQAEDLHRAVISSDRLMVVVNEVLDLAQIEADEVEFQSMPFDLVAVCNEAVDSFRPLAAEKGLDLVCWLSHGLETNRIGDQQKIHQILTNLLSNAIKFTLRGQVKLTVSQGHEDSVFLVVEDSGQGIDKEQQAELFQPFTAISADSTGTGLGLSICRTFVNGMGGSITVASEPGVGSTFTVELPLSIENSVFEPVVEETDNKVVTGLRVLSVDDDEVNRLVLQRHLEQLGGDITSVVNGQQAVEKFIEDDYDLILMDLLMPVMDGFQAAAEIRRMEREQGLNPVRIVAITASLVGKVEEQCRQAGMNGFLSKPFSKQQLEQVLNESKKDLDG